jgi:phosphomannomutase
VQRFAGIPAGRAKNKFDGLVSLQDLESMKVPSIFQKAVADKKLMISVSGMRAVLPAGLGPNELSAIATAFADTTDKTLVLGRDSRITGEAILSLFRAILMLRGKTVIDTGIAPTPTVKAVVALQKAGGGLIVTASHNPEEWNGLKFLSKGGFFYDQKAIETLLHEIESPTFRQKAPGRPGTTKQIDGIDLHIRAILKSLPNLSAIRKRRFSVVVDAVGGAGREALPRLLEELGCKVIPLYCEASDRFPRPPEPTPSALKKFSALVKKTRPAVGFALDPDADRLVTGSPALGAVHEEYTLPLAFLGKRPTLVNNRPGILTVNLSTSTLLDTIAAPHRVERTAVGEANVVGHMRMKKALFGGEGNGGVIDPTIPSYGRDSLTGAAWILSALAAYNARNLDDLLKELPPLFMSKEKLERKEDLDHTFARFESIALNTGRLKTVDHRDGLYLLFQDGSWLHLRASNTEPIIRLIAQANDRKGLKELLELFR